MGMELGDPSVNYTTKELLARIEANMREQAQRLEGKLDGLTALLGSKVDKSDLAVVLQRLAVVESFQERAALTEVQRNAPMLLKGEKYMEKVDHLSQKPIVVNGDEYIEKVDTLVQTSASIDVLRTYRKWLVTSISAAVASAGIVIGFIFTHVRFH